MKIDLSKRRRGRWNVVRWALVAVAGLALFCCHRAPRPGAAGRLGNGIAVGVSDASTWARTAWASLQRQNRATLRPGAPGVRKGQPRKRVAK